MRFCKLCADESGDLVSLEDEFIEKILNYFGFNFDSSCSFCFTCVSTIQQFRIFIEQCQKAQRFLTYCLENEGTHDDIQNLRLQFGLEKDTTHLEVKDEFMDSNDQVEALDCDENSLNELEYGDMDQNIENDFAVIEDIPLNNKNTADVDATCTAHANQCNEEMQLEYSCHLCGMQFENFLVLQSHCRKEHDSNCSVTCICGALLASRAQIHMHRKLHNFNKHPCKHCNRSFKSNQSLQNHIKKNHHDNEKLLLMCTVCAKRFDSEKKLKTHLTAHLPDEKKMIFPCDYCDKKFTKSVNVQAHIKAIHQLERPFLCSDCGKNFSTKGALKEHQIIHQNVYPYQCIFCPKKFKNLPRLKTHEDIHNTTKYICNICGISLNTKRTLKMHMVVHSDQKKYKCQYCGSSFKRSKALKNHLILHSGLRPYLCEFCDKTFANGSNCRSHKKKAHPIELAALEASGKTAGSAPNIPRLEQLQPKIEERARNVISSNENKQPAEHNSENLQKQQILESIASASLIDCVQTQ